MQLIERSIMKRSNTLMRSLLHKYNWLLVRLTKFGLVGASGFLVDMSIYTLLFDIFGIPHLVARACSYWVSASWNWFWNRNFTFTHIEKRKKFTQWMKYLGMCMISFMPNWGTYYLLTSYVPFFSEYKQLALIAGVGFGMLFNFSIASVFVFVNNSSENQKY